MILNGRLLSSLVLCPVLLLFGQGIWWLLDSTVPGSMSLGAAWRSGLRVAVLLILYLAAAKGIDWALAWAETEGRLEPVERRTRFHDRLARTGLFLTAAWLVLAAVQQELSVAWVMAGLLVPVGLFAGTPAENPQPAPLFPLPSPPSPLPPPAPAPDGREAAASEVHHIVLEGDFETDPAAARRVSRSFLFDVRVPDVLYRGYVGRTHEVKEAVSYVQFANAAVDDGPIGELAADIRRWVTEHRLDSLDEINLVLRLSRCFRYESDEERYGREYPKYPLETLVEQRGDCEDFAILCAVLLYRLGHRAALVLMQTEDCGHAAVAVEAPRPVSGLSFAVPELGIDMFFAEVTPSRTPNAPRNCFQCRLGEQPSPDASRYRIFPVGHAPDEANASQPR